MKRLLLDIFIILLVFVALVVVIDVTLDIFLLPYQAMIHTLERALK